MTTVKYEGKHKLGVFYVITALKIDRVKMINKLGENGANLANWFEYQHKVRGIHRYLQRWRVVAFPLHKCYIVRRSQIWESEIKKKKK